MKLLAFIFEQPSYKIISRISLPEGLEVWSFWSRTGDSSLKFYVYDALNVGGVVF